MECQCSETGFGYGYPALDRFELTSKNVLGEPESTATSPSSSTPSGHLKTTNGSHHMVGPIIGGKYTA